MKAAASPTCWTPSNETVWVWPLRSTSKSFPARNTHLGFWKMAIESTW